MKKISYSVFLCLIIISCQSDFDSASMSSQSIEKRANCDNIVTISQQESTSEGCCQWIVSVSEGYLLQNEEGQFYATFENNEYNIQSCNSNITVYVVQYNPLTNKYDKICIETLTCSPCDQIAYIETNSPNNCCSWQITVPSGYTPQINGNYLFTSGGGIYNIAADCGEEVTIDLLQDNEIICSRTFTCEELTIEIDINSEYEDECCIHTFNVSNPNCVFTWSIHATVGAPPYTTANPQSGIYTAEYCGDNTDAKIKLVLNKNWPCTSTSDLIDLDECQ